MGSSGAATEKALLLATPTSPLKTGPPQKNLMDRPLWKGLDPLEDIRYKLSAKAPSLRTGEPAQSTPEGWFVGLGEGLRLQSCLLTFYSFPGNRGSSACPLIPGVSSGSLLKN